MFKLWPMRTTVLATLLSLAALPCLAPRAATLDRLDLDAYRGKVVLLDFWASWCGPCKESFPWMQRMAHDYADRGLVVIAVNVDHDRSLAERFLRDQQPRFAVYFDPQGQLAEHYQVNAMPSSLYIDRSGKIRYMHRGFVAGDREDAERTLSALVAEH
jgi:thiol-disulfide isomerase/thioredoxin